MHRTLVPALIIVTGLVGAPQSALAQGGSTGGSLGKSGQELSGGRAQDAPPGKPPRRGTDGGQSGKSRPATGGPKTFTNPTVNGIRVNWCMYSGVGQGCGEPSATAWCRSKGLSRSIDYKWELVPSAYQLGDRVVCSGFCGGFTVVTCE